jgi:hypothetical protein
MYRKYTSTKLVEQPPKVISPSILQPKTLRDCEIMINRVTHDYSRIQNEIQNDQETLDTIADEITQLQKQIEILQENASKIRTDLLQKNETIKQNDVNLEALSNWSHSFVSTQNTLNYTSRCTEFIRNYLDDNNNLPDGTVIFLKLQSTDLDMLTSSEIIQLAHYIHVCNIIQTGKSNIFDDARDDIYAYNDNCLELYNSSMKRDRYFYRYCGELYHSCTNIPEDENGEEIVFCCNHRHAWCLNEFNEITLDTKDILFYERVF